MVHTPPDEQTCLLIAHWFFEMLDMTVSLNDGRCIWAHATECLEKRQQIGLSLRTHGSSTLRPSDPYKCIFAERDGEANRGTGRGHDNQESCVPRTQQRNHH